MTSVGRKEWRWGVEAGTTASGQDPQNYWKEIKGWTRKHTQRHTHLTAGNKKFIWLFHEPNS